MRFWFGVDFYVFFGGVRDTYVFLSEGTPRNSSHSLRDVHCGCPRFDRNHQGNVLTLWLRSPHRPIAAIAAIAHTVLQVECAVSRLSGSLPELTF